METIVPRSSLFWSKALTTQVSCYFPSRWHSPEQSSFGLKRAPTAGKVSDRKQLLRLCPSNLPTHKVQRSLSPHLQTSYQELACTEDCTSHPLTTWLHITLRLISWWSQSVTAPSWDCYQTGSLLPFSPAKQQIFLHSFNIKKEELINAFWDTGRARCINKYITLDPTMTIHVISSMLLVLAHYGLQQKGG